MERDEELGEMIQTQKQGVLDQVQQTKRYRLTDRINPIQLDSNASKTEEFRP